MNLAKPPAKIPILIVLAYWEGDRGLARQAAALMADLQPHHVGDAAKVLVVCRQDSEIDEEIVSKLSEKFNVLTHVATSPMRGWPGGCNGMFATTAQYIGNAVPNVECFFWMEADCTPMYCNWFTDLGNAWASRPPQKHIVGCICDAHGDGSGIHLTGCALYHPQISRIMPQVCACDLVAWDWYCRRSMVENGHHTNAIGFRYKCSNVEESLADWPCSVFHGCKCASLLNHVRKKRLPPPPVEVTPAPTE